MSLREKDILQAQTYWRAVAVFLVLAFGSNYQASAATGPIYQVAAESALLRDYPSPDSGILVKLEHFDQVEYVDSSAHGWWKVRSQRTGVTGWMTADLLRAVQFSPPPSALKTEYYYVNTPSIDLRVIPLASAATTGTVQLNDRVEKLGAAPSGWTKVKNPRTGKTGWLQTRYLASHPVTAPQAAAPKKRVSKSCVSKKKKKSATPKEKEAVEEQAKPM